MIFELLFENGSILAWILKNSVEKLSENCQYVAWGAAKALIVVALIFMWKFGRECDSLPIDISVK